MIFLIKVHRNGYMHEEEYYTASEAVKDFHVMCKKWKGKKVTVVMEDEKGNRYLLRNLKKGYAKI